MDICLIFRKKDPVFFSIEKVFASVLPIIKREYAVKEYILPFYTRNIITILKNIIAAKRQKADLYHVTGDVHYVVLALPRKRTLLTIHDCVFMNHPNRIKRLILGYLFLKWPVRHCCVVATISEKSRKDIIRYAGCPPHKVIVIPNPLNSGFTFFEKRFNANCPVILFIGSTPNKNLGRVIEAVKGISCVLDIVGTVPSNLIQVMDREKINYRQSYALSEEQLMDKYKECDMVLFPSTFEGFGLPIIEAQQTGRPVITSDLSPMKEVAGNGACLVDPFSVQSIHDAIKQVIMNEAYRRTIVENGLANAQRFIPEGIAASYLKLYNSVRAESNVR